MERIVLEVDDQTAKAWRNTSAKLRNQISKNLENILSDSLGKTQKENFELLLQDARKEASQNGLTEEVLAQLLNDEN
ncbi:hypothetical protein [Mucilaginibacter sp. FT3.2]|uniref:hypothetical protein n=1 Tax=Mucilaginibacter sp. FT3.2 TaxID=2723090 RepID=UPI0016095CF0|nr:hypothetical protein [Mucilaginibacter sp. FT3.2]MBB6229956.1 hypothetical protein [Mucilaginibacter sp. FT3.2]